MQSSTTHDPGYQSESDKLTDIHTAGDHMAQIYRGAQRYNKHKTEKHKISTKEEPPINGQ